MDRIVDLDEVKELAQDAYYDLWNAARAVGRELKIYLHWTAGGYYTTYSHYHFNITGDGKIHQTAPLNQIVSGTWRRNTGSISITLCAARNAYCTASGRVDLGDCPPTDDQIEAMAQLTATLCEALDIADENGNIFIKNVMTHGEAANNEDGEWIHEPYAVWSYPQPSDGDTRWDLAVLHEDDEWRSGGQTLRGKTIWYIINWRERGVSGD